MPDLATHYLDEARRQMRGTQAPGRGAMAQLKDEELFRHDSIRNRIPIADHREAYGGQHALALY
jgi:hypothetical protein